jgi:hypothetical protein
VDTAPCSSSPSGVLQGSCRCCTVSCRAWCKRGQLVQCPSLAQFFFFVSATYSKSATSLSALLEGWARAAGILKPGRDPAKAAPHLS